MPTATDSPGHCGSHCPLAGGDTQATNPCPFMDSCAMWRDGILFEAQEARERLERLVKTHPEIFSPQVKP